MAANEVWVTFNKGVPIDAHLSKLSAEQNAFHSDTVEHYIHVETGDRTKEEQLVKANLALVQQVEELTRLLERAEKRMGVIEQLGGVPVLLRRGKAA